MEISQEAFDLIVSEEITSKATYIKKYQAPVWPGASSGITIGIGYDLGQVSKIKIQKDWNGKVSDSMLDVMVSCSGVVGQKAARLLPSVKSKISIPWEAALQVFSENDIPLWYGTAKRALPNFEKLSPTCKGVLVSLVFNRGAGGFTSDIDRNREMRAIRKAMEAQEFDKIPGQLRSMARLWPTLRGLQDRRVREAALFQKGLKEEIPPKKPDISVQFSLDGIKDSKYNSGNTVFANDTQKQSFWKKWFGTGVNLK